jgi:hypothetical protein
VLVERAVVTGVSYRRLATASQIELANLAWPSLENMSAAVERDPAESI